MTSTTPNKKLNANARAFVPTTASPTQSRPPPEAGDSRRRNRKNEDRNQNQSRGEPRARTHAETSRPKQNKQSGNHLLNFQYDRRPQQPQQVQSSPARSRWASSRKRTGRPLSKEQFLQANFAFIVNPYATAMQEGFYSPDELIDWDDIERVSFPTSAESPYRCPICLETPNIPKITRCGHCFCLTCILRHLDGELTRRCPMCMTNILREDLRSLVFTHTCTPAVGEPFDFTLLHCARGTLSPYLPNQDHPRTALLKALHGTLRGAADSLAGLQEDLPETAFEVLPTNEDPSARFCRVVVASPETVMEYIYREQAQLESLREQCYRAVADTEFLPYIAEALHLLSEKQQQWALRVAREKKRVRQLEHVHTSPSITTQQDEKTEPTSRGDAWNEFPLQADAENIAEGATSGTPTSPADQDGSVEKSEGVESIEAGSSETSDTPLQVTAASHCDSDGTQLFYQAENGDLIFLHPLNMQCLVFDHEGDIVSLPYHMSAKVLEVERVRVSYQTRRQYPFLSHLPQHCEVMLVELDFRKTVSKETLDHFRPELNRRVNKRKVQAKKAAQTAQSEADERQAILIQQQDIKERYEAVKRHESEQLSQLLHGPRVGQRPGEEAADEHEEPSLDRSSPHEGWSFARIAQMGGHFPSLSELQGTPIAHPPSEVESTPTLGSGVGAWGRPQRQPVAQAPPSDVVNIEATIASPTSTEGKSSKKKSKGQRVFSNAGMRSYK